MKRFQRLLIAAACGVALSGCAGGIDRATTPWNQSRGDISNTDQKFAGPTSRSMAVRGSVFVGPTSGFTSPVIGGDGSVFVSTFAVEEADPGNAIVKISGGAPPAILERTSIAGQLSTPAIDDAGNVFLTSFSRTASAQVFGLTSVLGRLWSYQIPGHVVALGPPKLLKLGTQTLIFVIAGGGTPTGAHLMMFSVGGELLSDTLFCASYHSGIGGIAFTISPVPLGPPDVPAHGVAIRTAANGNIYIVAAADACGLTPIELVPGASATDPPTLKILEPLLESDHEYFNEPAITADGTVVVTSEKDDWQTFRFWAYDLILGIQKFGKALPAWPADSVALEPFQTASAYSLLNPSDSTHAQLVRFGLDGRGDMSAVDVDNTASSIAVAGSKVLVVTATGIQLFDLFLGPLGTANVQSQSALAIGRSGEVYGVDSSGNLFRIPPS